MSHELTAAGRDHVVLERGEVAERWRSTWDSLHLLTPNWMSRLPGWSYTGADPDGYMSVAELRTYLAGYARSFDAPVRHQTAVGSVRPDDDGYVVATDGGTWSARHVVVATGACDLPARPAMSRAIDPSIRQ